MTMLKNVLAIGLLGLTLGAYGQSQNTEQQFTQYFKQLESSGVDTILILKSGCIGCEVIYTDTAKSISNGQTIYVLTQENGQFKLAVFDEVHGPKYSTMDTCSLFDKIFCYKPLLRLKDPFYKKELAKLKRSKFFPPLPIHYSFEELIIQLPDFKYDFAIKGKDTDYLGLNRESENWFKVTKAIIEAFINYSQSIKD